ncbi:MAG: hypothetical protein KDD63_24740 [Bacteroidetes bacterium]|nr:hypothetical protein [Bacteroidota bacterium]
MNNHTLPYISSLLIRFFFFMIFLGNILIAQDQNQSQLKGTERIYNEFIGLNQLIYNGRFYRYFYLEAASDQYLIDPELYPGQLTFQGITYPDVELNYDIYNDIVFLLWDQSGFIYYIIPNQTQVDSFTIAQMKFIRLKDQEIQGLKAGFYQQAFHGQKSQFLVKKQKTMAKQNRTQSTDKWFKFVRKDAFFVVMNGKAIQVNSKKDLIKLDPNGQTAGFIKSSKLKFRPRREDFVPNVKTVLSFLENE